MTSEELDALPVMFGLQTAARALGIGKNQAYRLLRDGQFPVRVITVCGRHKVSRFDLLRYLGAESVQGSEVRTLRSVRTDGAA